MNNNTKSRWKHTSKKERQAMARTARTSRRPKVGGFTRQQKKSNEENL